MKKECYERGKGDFLKKLKKEQIQQMSAVWSQMDLCRKRGVPTLWRGRWRHVDNSKDYQKTICTMKKCMVL